VFYPWIIIIKESGYDLDTKLEAAIALLNNNQTLIAKGRLTSFTYEMTKNSESINSISSSPLAHYPFEKQYVDAAKDIVKAIDLKRSTVQFRGGPMDLRSTPFLVIK
jgi:hypothetical protein